VLGWVGVVRAAAAFGAGAVAAGVDGHVRVLVAQLARASGTNGRGACGSARACHVMHHQPPGRARNKPQPQKARENACACTCGTLAAKGIEGCHVTFGAGDASGVLAGLGGGRWLVWGEEGGGVGG